MSQIHISSLQNQYQKDTAAENNFTELYGLTGTALQPGDNISALNNDAGYITNATHPQFFICNTAGSTAAKVATSSSSYTLQNGDFINVYFKYDNTLTTTITLNVNNTGAKTLYVFNANSGNNLTYLKAGWHTCYYNGANWYTIGFYPFQNNLTDNAWGTRFRNIRAGSAISANYFIGMYFSNGKEYWKNLGNGVSFNITQPVLRAGSAISANSTGTNNYDRSLWVYSAIKTQFGLSLSTLTAYAPCFFKGTLSGTTFTIASSGGFTQTIPTTNDGYDYYYIGHAHSTAYISMTTYHGIYRYSNGAFIELNQALLTNYFPLSGGSLNSGANILLTGSNPYVGLLETGGTQYYLQSYQGEVGISVGGMWTSKRLSLDANGKVIIPSNEIGDGTYTYTLPGKTGTIAETSDISNPNLLINPDFAINQRGNASYTSTTSTIYTVDMWRIYKGTVSKNSGSGVTITPSGTDSQFVQMIENPQLLDGKNLVLSANINGITYYSANETYDYSNTNTAICTIAVPNVGTLRLRVYNNTLYVQFLLNNSNLPTNIINWIKLEIGSFATTFTPPNIADELTKCQRSVFKITNKQGQTYSGFGIAYGDGSGARMFIPCNLRVSPTVTKSGNFMVCSNGTNYTVTSVAVQSWDENYGLVLKFGLSSALANGQCGYIQSNNSVGAYILLDSSIY